MKSFRYIPENESKQPVLGWNTSFSLSATMLSLIWSDVSPSCSGLISFPEFDSGMRKPLWEYVFLISFIADRVTYCLLIDIYS